MFLDDFLSHLTITSFLKRVARAIVIAKLANAACLQYSVLFFCFRLIARAIIIAKLANAACLCSSAAESRNASLFGKTFFPAIRKQDLIRILWTEE